ncbi:molybdopterin-binding protein [Ruminococcaceae bacterium OttesenSCG-928-I18]|nr:molybdopterin-binding protein [Ruminococcaceae bacterium OttesenSCG-928-I18]
MKLVQTKEAVGHVLCHDLTQIIPGVVKDAVFRKGHVVTEEDIPVLLSMGKENLYVWENQTGMLHENEAAEVLYSMAAGPNMRPTEVKEGKIELIAEKDGLLQVDVERLRKVNRLGEMLISTRHTNFPAKEGDRLAGVRVIPLVIPKEKMDLAKKTAGSEPLLTLYPYRHKKAAIITTGSEVFKGRIEDKFTPVVRSKLEEYGAEVIGHTIVDDDHEKVSAAIQSWADKGAQLVVCTGGMSVDPDDKTPLAIKNTGARVVSYGAPVLPGAMFMLAYLGDKVPILGLPGCVMYARRTIFDLILPRVMADVPVDEEDLAGLGHGGLCLNCENCIFPNCGFGAGV